MDDAVEEEGDLEKHDENFDPIRLQGCGFAKKKQLRIGFKKKTRHWEGQGSLQYGT